MWTRKGQNKLKGRDQERTWEDRISLGEDLVGVEEDLVGVEEVEGVRDDDLYYNIISRFNL